MAATAAFSGLSASAAPTTGPRAVPQVQNVSIILRAGDRVSAPNFALAPGVPVRLAVVNFTHEFHTFTINRLGVSALILPALLGQTSKTTLVTFTPRRTGAFKWHCVICPSGAHGQRHAMSGEVYLIIDPSALP
ncbi:MAG: hypothetical protein ACXWYO_05890 [Gaiellaceae bacterium]